MCLLPAVLSTALCLPIACDRHIHQSPHQPHQPDLLRDFHQGSPRGVDSPEEGVVAVEVEAGKMVNKNAIIEAIKIPRQHYDKWGSIR